ncbi:hypothetical protein CB1_000117011 [Camelus ferus]|nr:hypothetical protein CB1_000117011 [Camelus ferus]
MLSGETSYPVSYFRLPRSAASTALAFTYVVFAPGLLSLTGGASSAPQGSGPALRESGTDDQDPEQRKSHPGTGHRSDPQLLAQFYHADEELSQDNVLNIINQIMDVCIPQDRAPRDFCVKFPEEIRHDNLAGQLWFGAECLAAGSIIMNRELESMAMRPLAKELTRSLEDVRGALRDQALRDLNTYTEKMREALRHFDVLFAEFELSYVSAMVPVKSPREYYVQQEVIVLFCETVERALDFGYLTQDMIDDYEPALMFTIPRLAIVCTALMSLQLAGTLGTQRGKQKVHPRLTCPDLRAALDFSGLVVYADGPLNLDRKAEDMSELFRPFHMLLRKIRDLLQTLTEEELHTLERNLCISQDVEFPIRAETQVPPALAPTFPAPLAPEEPLSAKAKNAEADLACSMQYDDQELEQLSRMVHKAGDEMSSLLSPPISTDAPIVTFGRVGAHCVAGPLCSQALPLASGLFPVLPWQTAPPRTAVLDEAIVLGASRVASAKCSGTSSKGRLSSSGHLTQRPRGDW